jgi:cytochrome b561
LRFWRWDRVYHVRDESLGSTTRRAVRAMTRRPSLVGVVVGVLIALALPILYVLVAQLLSSGVLQLTRSGFPYDVLNSLAFNALAQSVLAMVGIVVVGRAARLESTWAWIGLYLVALPVLAFGWFLTYATLGGAMGNPF